MSRLYIVATLGALALSGCGQDQAESPTAATPDTVVPTPTRFVDVLPTYESLPLPEGLVWVTNNEDPPFASPDAKRGGTFRLSMTSFPLTLRLVGPDSNGSFVAYLRTGQVDLTAIHPNTLKYIPLLATEWAFDPDGKTVYYRLDRDAHWSDGMPVTADDYVFTKEFYRSEFIVDPWYNNHYTNNIVDIRKHDDYTISVVGATPKAQADLLHEYGFGPVPRHYHKLDARWVEDYNWRTEPVTGPYRISRVEKGQFVEFERVADWWGDKNRYLANRYNPDKVRITVIRDTNVAWEYFLRGELDTFGVVQPNYWYEKAQGEPFDKGYIQKITFYTDRQQPSMGMWLNMDDPLLSDLNVRLGLAYSMNVDLMLKTVLRGDYERLKSAYDGYGVYSNPAIEPRPFDLARADEYFNAAGWTERGPDGIRVKDGQRLAVRVSYATQDHTARLVVLREEARKAGVELNLQLLDASASFKQSLEKKHQIAWMAWGTNITPQFWEHYHSVNAHVPQNNNINNIDNPELDALITEYDRTTDTPTRIRAAHRIQQITYDLAGFIPMYKVPYTREANWRWVKLPAHYGTRITEALFEPLGGDYLRSDGLLWIDEQAKQETLDAMAAGRTFPPVTILDETWHVR